MVAHSGGDDATDPANGSGGHERGDAGGDGGGDHGLTEPGALGRAVGATRAVVSARVELQTLYAGPDVPARAERGAPGVRMVQRAAFDRRTGVAEAEADMSDLAAALADTDATVPGDYTSPTRVVVAGEDAYTQIGPMARLVGLEPGTWVRRDLDSLATAGAGNETVALLAEPFGLLGLLERPIDDVQLVGREGVRGVATTHLAVSLRVADPTSAVEGAAAEGAEGSPDALAARFRRLGIALLPVEVWVDDDLVIRRLELTIDGSIAGRGTTPGEVTTSLEVYDVRQPLDIPLPDPADVVDQADLRADPDT